MSGASDHQPERTLLRTFVGGLPYHCHEEELRAFMERFGSVEQIYISKDIQGQHKGFAFVNFARLHPGKYLFGEHSFKSKPIEVKLNLLNQLFMQSVPPFVTIREIRSAIESLGFPVEGAMLGNGLNGIPPGTCCVKLVDDHQLSSAAIIGKIVVRGVSIHMEAKTNKFLSSNESFSNKKKPCKRHLQEFYSDKKAKNQHYHYHDSSPTSSNLPKHESDLFSSGLMMTATRPSESDFSMGEIRESQEFLSFTGGNKRKKSATLQSGLMQFPSIRNKIEKVEQDVTEHVQLGGSTVLEEDRGFFAVPMTRHNSETLPGNSFDNLTATRRLSSFSSSFYSDTAARHTIAFSSYTPEVKIAFFTFPGRD